MPPTYEGFFSRMNDRTFLEWISASIVRHGTNPCTDYIGRLCSIARAMPDNQTTSNTGLDDTQMARMNKVYHKEY